MNVLSLHQPTVFWWVEIHTSAPQQTYHLGPFNSREEARISRGTHIEALYYEETGDIVASIKQRCFPFR